MSYLQLFGYTETLVACFKGCGRPATRLLGDLHYCDRCAADWLEKELARVRREMALLASEQTESASTHCARAGVVR